MPETGSGPFDPCEGARKYQPSAAANSAPANAYMRPLPTADGSAFTPSGVTSSIQASNSATGNPTIRSKVTSLGTQSGNCSCGASVATTWISSHATTR